MRLSCSKALTGLIRHPLTHECLSGEPRFDTSATHSKRCPWSLKYSFVSLNHRAPRLRFLLLLFSNYRAASILTLSEARTTDAFTTVQPRLQRNMCSQPGMPLQYEVSSPRSRPRRRRVRPNSDQEMVRHQRYSLDSQQATNWIQMNYAGFWDPTLGPQPGFVPPGPGLPPGNQLPPEDDLAEAVEKGKRCSHRDIYYVPTDQDPDRFHWVDEKPLHYGATGDKLRTKKTREAFAVNVYHRFNEKTDEWLIHEVRINSELLHTALEKILEGYPGLTQHEMKSFSPPFLPFIHRWQAMVSYKDHLDPDSETKRHLQLLQEVLEPLLKESFEKIEDVKKTGHVAFEDLNLVYIPAMIVLEHETDSAGMVRSCQLMYPPPPNPIFWSIGVDVVDWDGRRCGLLAQEKRVPQYYGER